MGPRGEGQVRQDMFEYFAVISHLTRGRPLLTPNFMFIFVYCIILIYKSKFIRETPEVKKRF
jgi:hypothetical protein